MNEKIERARKLAEAARNVAPGDPQEAIELLSDAVDYALLAIEAQERAEGTTA